MSQYTLEEFSSTHSCPDCGDEFDNEHGLKIHLGKKHKPTSLDNLEDSDYLQHMYHGEGMTLGEIADETGSTQGTVSYWMDKHGIERRTSIESRELRGTQHLPEKNGPHSDADWLRERYYDDGATTTEMASEAGVSEATITRAMDEHGMERRTAGDYLRKEDTIKTAKHDNHEQVRFSVNGTTYYYDVHRLLAIAEFGLDEVAGKIVHHKNQIPWDNRVENFELIESQAEHARMHAEERQRDAKGRFS